jgi:hypothetical protein
MFANMTWIASVHGFWACCVQGAAIGMPTAWQESKCIRRCKERAEQLYSYKLMYEHKLGAKIARKKKCVHATGPQVMLDGS